MTKIVCVFIVYKNLDIIKKSFESVYKDYIDFIIVENPSDSSQEIEEYFRTKKILKYIRYNQNCWGSTVTLFMKYFKECVLNYEYVIITDGDILVDDIDSTVSEILNILEKPNVIVCCTDLKMENLPNLPESKNWIPKSKINYELCYNNKNTGVQLMTFKRNNIDLINQTIFIDSIIAGNLRKKNLLWVSTIKNKAYHLTWDLYKPGNPYYEYKRKNKMNSNINEIGYEIINIE